MPLLTLRPSDSLGWAFVVALSTATVTTGIATTIIIAAASVAGVTQATLAKLEADTRAQCAAAGWPAYQAAAHRDFCRVYGYPTP